MISGLLALVPTLARQRGIELAPNWAANMLDAESFEGPDGLHLLTERAGWDEPIRLGDRPRADEFPLLVHTEGRGWAIAGQWDSHETIRVVSEHGLDSIAYSSASTFYDIEMPDPIRKNESPRAASIFWKALLKRKSVFVSAAVATVVANIITLATSLYSMQVYDRVIPAAGYSTLWVLTVGVLVALAIDFALRATRALMIERESTRIDFDVSEFFFARSQAVRLDARPPGIGTMAAQLRGLEQVRGLMSSGSLFLVADLPFALLFILVIAALGGAVALVPLISFPIALGLAFLFAWLIRGDTNRAQISGNRKNGLLVETLDAAETVKANRGHWHMLGRWNQLMDEVHYAEDPVKRWSSIAGSIFSTLQQLSYVALIAWGAVEVIHGNMTMGALIACAIIAGRVNGPLVTMLPNLIVQWGYARSSLRALDAILRLPLDDAPGIINLRPERMVGPLKLEQVKFGYPGAREDIDVPRLEISYGERVAIIGSVGSGKSTLLRLMAGLYAPGEGTVLLGGLDMAQIAADTLRRHIGYLPQDFRLVNGTLRDNLLLGLGDPGDDVLMDAAARTGLDRMIASHPRGLELRIEEGGRSLSGGQRALTGLTRLMLARPRLLLLDEPTANLDQTTENAALGALGEEMDENGTLILVTHKLQLLSMVNRVIVMAGGRVILDGATKDVVARLQGRAGKVAKVDSLPTAGSA
ncbi:ATP-binding cassette domain-containing protein [Sphingomonas sp. SCN 67-18]|uniref:ATP-binding cassette domain-containing protein n=1 Tax=uncultured Sphingomonas sp. TaxID=158754 RepID=UPI000A75AD3F|nr:ATP-binding cassette domain-containing protein [Sphingomonas sp. SCN 67-18]